MERTILRSAELHIPWATEVACRGLFEDITRLCLDTQPIGWVLKPCPPTAWHSGEEQAEAEDEVPEGEVQMEYRNLRAYACKRDCFSLLCFSLIWGGYSRAENG